MVWKIFCLRVAFACKCILVFMVFRELIFWVNRRDPLWAIQVSDSAFNGREYKSNSTATLNAALNVHDTGEAFTGSITALWFPRGGWAAQSGEIAVIYLLLLQVTVALISFLETMLITYLSYKVRTWFSAHTLSFFNQCLITFSSCQVPKKPFWLLSHRTQYYLSLWYCAQFTDILFFTYKE